MISSITFTAYVLGSKVITSVPRGTGVSGPGGVQFIFMNMRSILRSKPAFLNATSAASTPGPVRFLMEALVVSAPT